MSENKSKVFNLLGYIGVIFVLVVMQKLFFDFDNQLYSGLLFVGLILLINNITFLKRERKVK